MRQLTLEQILQALLTEIQSDFPLQDLTPESPNYGAYIPLVSNVPEIGHMGTTRFSINCGLLALAQTRHPDIAPNVPDTDTLIHRMRLGLNAMLNGQRPSGLVDLRSTNYDSSPDTGFVVQALGSFVDLVRDEPLFSDILVLADTFIRRAVPGMLTGGFHTPNHRWVLASALALAGRLYPDLDVRAGVEAYLAEGFDVDAEGTYLERSVGVYDAVTNRALLMLAENWDDPAVIEAVHAAVNANLNLNLHLFHADGTAETGLSHRQDYGTRQVPAPLATAYLHSSILQPNPIFLQAAHWLWSQIKPGEPEHITWLTQLVLKHGAPPPSDAVLPTHYARLYPINQLWRYRHDKFSATVFGGVTNLLTLVYGQAELSHMKIAQTYFGVGKFIAEDISYDGDAATLKSSGQQHLHKPGYELPLGRPVPRDEWDAAMAEREWKYIPPAESILTFTPIEDGDGLECLYRTLDGLDDVTTQISLDFPAGGFWETEDTAFTTQPGQVIFLKQGTGRMRFGTDVIEIGPGANAHQYQHMRHSEPIIGDRVRILITFVTPVDHRFHIRAYTGR